jgi:hypothetical protein
MDITPRTFACLEEGVQTKDFREAHDAPVARRRERGSA